ncbi:hypothetical protein TVAG_328530 [Trichomonas vaginalis G3]|uniref:Uncharacterized protein n=1 Tax=Trichomonas vaginalis (strain ATCC PRA-98 / G3) TaxID=412133 RepID=A2F4S8_TRIV3|nr:hypothetical protein TVAGG3_0149050 [Trichomonas vaginalis G3]EAY00091.1 hypothetical protein TVAG_328530 [Trichomonas vaginalis G3]KAI5547147.1 hypothetical protein TVAGG3_0149050 [Trichomonas vaginalis G3]|eukprot:XP_001313020.1 hypothetical protein [Trichomonas vaginalis G3]
MSEKKFSKIPDPTPNGKTLSQLFQSSSESTPTSSRQSSPCYRPLKSPMRTPLREDYLSPSIPNTPIVKAILESPSAFKRFFANSFVSYFTFFMLLFSMTFTYFPARRYLESKHQTIPDFCTTENITKWDGAIRELVDKKITEAHTYYENIPLEEILKCYDNYVIKGENPGVLIYKFSDHQELIIGVIFMIISLSLHLLAFYGNHKW